MPCTVEGCEKYCTGKFVKLCRENFDTTYCAKHWRMATDGELLANDGQPEKLGTVEEIKQQLEQHGLVDYKEEGLPF